MTCSLLAAPPPPHEGTRLRLQCLEEHVAFSSQLSSGQEMQDTGAFEPNNGHRFNTAEGMCPPPTLTPFCNRQTLPPSRFSKGGRKGERGKKKGGLLEPLLQTSPPLGLP